MGVIRQHDAGEAQGFAAVETNLVPTEIEYLNGPAAQ